jgi:L-2-hydroxycarboxylate dehydrogenase (NAD+)
VLMQINEIRGLMLSALKARNLDPDDAQLIVDDFLDAELAGSIAHGLGKFVTIDRALSYRQGEPVVVSQRGVIVHLDGKRELGQIAARKAALIAAETAKREGIGLSTLVNSGRYSRLAPYAAMIAREGLVGIVTNNAGPRAVAPHGSRTPILGTNPMAFGFPGHDEPYVIDFATAQRTWGEIRQAVLEGRSLPPGAFINGDGYVTTNPADVNAALPFGGHKGSALCLALELFAGLVAGAKIGLTVESEYDLGASFMAFSLAGESAADGAATVSVLLDEIRSSDPLPEVAAVAVPGDRSRTRREAALASGAVDVEGRTLGLLKAMASGDKGFEGDRLTR